MGLDIYFKKASKSTFAEIKERNTKLNEQIDALYEEGTEESIAKANELCGQFESGCEQVAYFRKVNFLLPFFGYEENLSDLFIEESQVEELISACEAILKLKRGKDGGIAEKDKADEILRTEDGFFFGNTEYDKWYVENVEDVLDVFTALLEHFDFENDYLIMHCWW